MTFIDAGAGTGKTSRLVRRIVRMVLDGTCSIDQVAAITFTDKAAAELRDRVRVALLNASQGLPIDAVTDDPAGPLPSGPNAQANATAALAQFHLAPISTLHAFAQRLLAAHTEVLGLPDHLDIVDDLAQAERFDRRWRTITDRLLTDDLLVDALDRSVALGVDLNKWRDIAMELDGQWDRCRVWAATQPQHQPVGDVPVHEVIAAFRQELAEARTINTTPTDKLVDRILTEVPLRLQELEEVDVADGFAACHALIASIMKVGNVGSAKNWPNVNRARDLAGMAGTVLGEVAHRAFVPVLTFLAREAVASAGLRRASGSITYHDVLVLARELVQEHPVSRAQCRQQYAYLLIDEFQDTDPLQADIALALSFAGDAHLDDPDDAVPLPAGEFDLEPGRLTFVGDPKQSIYRFRRADVGVYGAMEERFRNEVELLDANFRSRKPIVEWVNRTFTQLMTGPTRALQVDFQPLVAARQELEPELAGPVTTVFGGPVAGVPGDELKRQEAVAVAGLVAQALDGWEVIDRVTNDRRAAQPSDIAVLVRTRALLPQLSRALTALGVPFRFEGRGLAWGSQEVADVLVLLAALDDPADPAKVVAALRCRAIGASDEDLLAWKQACRRFALQQHEVCDGVVGEGLRWLASLHQRRFAMSVPDMVRAVIADRSLEALASEQPRPRDAWARLQLLVDTADQFAATSVTGTLREFLARCRWAAEQGATSSDRVVTEPDDDAVRVLTIHGAKGLEFPVVIVAGFGHQTRHGGLKVHWQTGADGPEPMMKLEVKLGDDPVDVDVRPRTYKEVTAEESHADALEVERLAYVACTRARDHLAVSVFHKEVKGDGKPRIGPDLYAAVTEAGYQPVEVPEAGPRTLVIEGEPDEGDTDVDGWLAVRAEALHTVDGELRTGRPSGQHDDAPKTAPAPRNSTLYDAKSGRRFGSAMHRVAETMMPDDSSDRLDALVAEAAAVFAVQDVARLRAAVDSLRSSRAWHDASTAPRWWRELPMDGTVGGVVMAAIADLVWEQPDGTIAVADWKSDSSSEAELRARYTRQLAAYATVLDMASSRPVATTVIVAVHPAMAALTEVGP